jgi:pimeloyl-ACP methyl ester carboxylesterase
VTRYAYLHGFASSPDSQKGVALDRAFRARGAAIERPDLNRPSFAKLSWNAALETLDETTAGDRWAFVGSSMGGYLSARFAELHPERIERLVLLCPAFDMPNRWPAIFGPERWARFRSDGFAMVEDAYGTPTPVHFALVEEASRHPAFPDVSCPVLLFHGRNDETVPIDSSRAYAKAHANVRLVELDDDHRLLASLDRIVEESLSFFGL